MEQKAQRYKTFILQLSMGKKQSGIGVLQNLTTFQHLQLSVYLSG